jgi:putative ABC transport system substrate-binding protein
MESIGAGAGPQAATRTPKSSNTQPLKCHLFFITLLQTEHGRMRSISARRRALLLVWLWLAVIGRASADPVLVLYPEAPDPYRQAFDQIMTGIARTVGGPVNRRKVTPDMSPAHIQAWLDRQERQTPVVILGQQTENVQAISQRHPNRYRLFVGGLIALPQEVPWPGVSLMIDPALFLQTLHEILPSMRHVIAFYHARDREWAPLVQQAAASRGVRVETVAITDAISAVRQITAVLKTLDPATTALWFATNTLDLDTELLFPFVLEQAWEQKIVVFSETITHAKRGFLFALYPNYIEVGAELGQRIRQDPAGQNAEFTLTYAANLALNRRTARHLGLVLREDVLQRARILFPQPSP